MTLSELNCLPPAARAEQLHKCCGATAWVEQLNRRFPFAARAVLVAASEAIWQNLTEADWREAFTHHPKIGDVAGLREKFAATSAWAGQEQGAVAAATDETLRELAAGNAAYEQRFGYIFIVCATGKSAAQMLALLQARLPHAPAVEIGVAAAEQAKITEIRLRKLLADEPA
ncbi:2-oxo-4-hydroxy-4-carboxy-5-ureidoimidazoline decarboxylase [Hymenobacter rubripertinctus]|uniref:2-oxo-4-hydroxy-4-carboxy-5-ureidoimidazoline decarboxylase n=1 Tax=Hymenobacter rubripertinctus TaxID=2029981 RepID=A0A418QX57_9BACT|nr:2-oxo-4-hydroxy-4-carboxy-5-ureidoimidazoline decarboxylase [Hymenobacter rubripertinctus]RIY09745.1 2-oxo-4-hydroxy-4-carboxy-5-ureidoimidazoline decarboxylase [Hymenobacter rubripertinctus]